MPEDLPHLSFEPATTIGRRRPGRQGPPPERDVPKHKQNLKETFKKASDLLAPASESPGRTFAVRLKKAQTIEPDVLQEIGFEFLGYANDNSVVAQADAGTEARLDAALSIMSGSKGGTTRPSAIKTAMLRIDGFVPFGADDRQASQWESESEPQALTDVFITPWPSEDRAETRRRLQTIQRILRQAGADDQLIDERSLALAARLTQPQIDLALHLTEVRLVSQNYLGSEDEDWDDPDQITVNAAEVRVAAGRPVIGIIDDLPDQSHALLASGVIKETRSFPQKGKNWTQPGSHGTRVAAIAAFGEISPVPGGPLAALPLAAARLETAVGQQTTLNDLRGALGWLRDLGVKVVNVSLNVDRAHIADFPDAPAVALDTFVAESNIAVVVSAGNVDPVVRDLLPSGLREHDYPHYLKHPQHRISSPGIAINVITVGATGEDLADPTYKALAGRSRPSAFTRVGPSPTSQGKAVKPEVVEFGGDWAVEITDPERLDKMRPELRVLTAGSTPPMWSMTRVTGTSFAAPRVANLMGQIAVQPRYSGLKGNGLRALTLISARSQPLDDRFADFEIDHEYLVGYGRPSPIDALNSSANRVVIFHEGAIPTNGHQLLALPIPATIRSAKGKQTLRIAVACNPPVSEASPDYALGQIQVQVLRGMTPGEIRSAYSNVPEEEADSAVSDARNWSLEPAHNSVKKATGYVRMAQFARLNPKYGDLAYVLVRHITRPPHPEDYREQEFAIAAEWACEPQDGVNLYAELQARLPVLAATTRARVQ